VGLLRAILPLFAFLSGVSRRPGAVWLLVQLLQVRALHHRPITFGWVTQRPVRLDIVNS